MHLPKTKETAGLIGKENLAKTKPGVIIVNAARGGLIDEQALADAITSGHVRAAGLDVFSTEPCTDSPLFELPQVVVTPHLGASTEEAQDRAGTDVAASVKLALAGKFVPDAVNVAAVWSAKKWHRGWTWCASSACWSVRCPTPRRYLSVQARGELASEDVEVLKLSELRGLFSAVVDEQVTFVNAPALPRIVAAADISTATESPNHRRWSTCARCTPTVVRSTWRHAVGPQQVQKLVQINGRNFDLRAEGFNLVVNSPISPARWAKSALSSAKQMSTSWPPSCPRTPAVRARRSSCAWTPMSPKTCASRSPRRSVPPHWKWLTSHEVGGYDRPGGHRRSAAGA
ncbi:hypothetical protein MSAR_00010 [Mycolicibacterium sarraceniae]|uniref:D-isomer specific 2-hydroxyacid dehydrogenase NAD-binding domain-containing protein n=1 Tax=Mycolicibacterium sarraceniae TaxID=1534348 RepID=A0A7I7SLH2_9MYCO|nr:hypothetical protein MSAR_00010 [Mycolicibacterium sarraceniae]